MWQSIASPGTSRECWGTIHEIERSLTEHLGNQLTRQRFESDAKVALDREVDSNAREVDSNARKVDPLMSSGDAGIALFFAYLDAAGRSPNAADLALEALARSTEALNERLLLPTLYTGFSGIGWVVEHLTRELFDADGDPAEAIDSALGDFFTSLDEKVPFELVGGLAGYGTYLVERLPNPAAAAILRRILDLLEQSREEQGVWYTPPEWLPPNQLEQMPRGCYNVGVAHGIPGVIGFLAAARREGFDDPRMGLLAENAVNWLLKQRWIRDGLSVFPAQIPPDQEPTITRTAWCYGDLGIAAVLLSAARSFDRPDWEAEALGIAREAARRSPEDTLTIDVGLCHGATGVAHLFNRIYQATGDAEMRDAARAWYQRLLDMRRPGEGMAGLMSWVDEGSGEAGWRSETGFLTGIAGVGLALLAAVTEIEPAWDRVLLVSVPPKSSSGETSR